MELRLAAAGSLRGDNNYVDTVQCSGSGSLPMEPVPRRVIPICCLNGPKEEASRGVA